jgi:hypothetical protein
MEVFPKLGALPFLYMNCPNCKCPNPQGATHCSMCYEVFNRSAAETYLRTVKRDRLLREKQENSGSSINIAGALQNVGQAVQTVDWSGMIGSLIHLIRRNKRYALIAGGIAASILLALLLTSSEVSRLLYGSRLAYRFSPKAATGYLIGFQTDLKSWTEKNGRLDTPVEDKNFQEIGNVTVQAIKISRVETRLTAIANEWIQIVTSGGKSSTRTFPRAHPSLAPRSVSVDKRGVIQHREDPPLPRMAASMHFLLPSFPSTKLRDGRGWREPVRWVEMIGDYKICWTGEFLWRLDGQVPCGADTCDQLSYDAQVQPQIWGGPAWAASGFHQASFTGTSQGTAVFDSRRGRLLTNTFSYDGSFRIPLADVGQIPITIRIGRYVHGAGALILRVSSKTDIRKQ